ncbi:MAG: hypothetical protein HFJ51_06560 [Clostridia bacterium]|nr:hypothetical protein [Clostridia bacterium]
MIGEITNNEEIRVFIDVTRYIDGGAVLGYGTASGGYMKVKDSYTEEIEYLEDRTSNQYPYPKAISKINEKNLQKIAEDMKIDYVHMEKQSDISEKIYQIKSKVENGKDTSDMSGYDDIYYIFAIPVLGLLAYEFLKLKKSFL